jgi:glycosyltransferase involved in cell wall biosynthesis
MSAYYEERKNHLLLVQAFKAAFEHDRDVRLLLHGRGGHLLEDVRRAAAGDERISFEMRVLPPNEFDAWWRSIDAYVLPSAGEGYSHTPREALMRAIPTAITDFSAHTTLVKRGTVVPIPVRGLEPAYKAMFKAAIGDHAHVRLDDLVEVLRFMRNNRDATRQMAKRGREQALELDTWQSSTLHLLAAIHDAS